MTTACRVCSSPLFPEPLLRLGGMPAQAQFLPDRAGLAADRGVTLTIRQCATCGLVQHDGEPVSYYREVIRAAGVSAEMRAFRRGQFGDLVARFGLRGKRVLEVGCGRGEYLRMLGEAGLEAHGLEWGEEPVKHCLESGLAVNRGFIIDGPLNAAARCGDFAAVFILSFLEHLPDPCAQLAGIHAILADDGIGVVEVPNFDMILERGLVAEFTSDHLLYFTQATLASTLERCGFDVVEITPVWHEYILSAIVRPRRVTPISPTPFLATQASLTRALRAFVDRHARVAVWGASHQSLAVLAMAQLGGRVKYVVDSAPFKQGRYTPATHIPIVGPDALRDDPVDALIVMAASYSREVARLALARFPDLHVAVMTETGLVHVAEA